MIYFPPAKINLGLHVLSKMESGFHSIETCFFPVKWTDILEVIPAKNGAFALSGLPVPGSSAKNLCLRAYELLKADYELPPVSIFLYKVIPMGAGLGGGSSDAANMLLALNSLFSLALSSSEMVSYAAKLGSDCAFFLDPVPMIGKGKGEILSPAVVNLNGKHLVIVKPDVHISTADAYRDVIPSTPRHAIEEVLSLPITEWPLKLTNDFEKSVFTKYPAIAAIKERFYQMDALYASMSGSGASVFGIFASEPKLPDEWAGLQTWTGVV